MDSIEQSSGGGGAASPLTLTSGNTSEVPLTIGLASGQTADAVQVNSFGGSGGDLLRLTKSGSLRVSAAIGDYSFNAISSGSSVFNVNALTGDVYSAGSYTTSTGYGVNAFGAYIGVNGSSRFEFYSNRIDASAPINPPHYAVASLPVGAEGAVAYASNGRKVGEGGGAGTGVPVYYSGGAWRVYSTDAAVAA